MSLELKESIETTLKTFAGSSSLRDAGIALFHALGYESKKTLRLKDNTLAGFTKQFSGAKYLNQERAMTSQWKSIDILFQLTDDEVRHGLGFGQEDMFASEGQVDDTRIESYLFVAIELKAKGDGNPYTRTDLSRITRALNHQDVFRVPIMLLFRHGDCLSLAVINRRLHKRDASRDVLEKVTLIKDITFADPLRAHIEILYDLALDTLYNEFKFTGFVGLHQAWEKRLGSHALNKAFYQEISKWYFDALKNAEVVMPRTIEEMTDDVEREKARSLFFIRLLTRLVFCWFLQEKGLVPRDLFRERRMKELLKDSSPLAGTYYRAFLQNLFFATLNQEQDKRDWRGKKKDDQRYDKNVGITNLWHYADLLTHPSELEALLRARVPFVNGGLFDCLDIRDETPNIFLDGFSERSDNTLHIPNVLFFDTVGHRADLSDVYHDKRREKEKVFGLIDILSRYKFTIEENTPLEEEIALDPELLGKVFENLLASFNEDTQTTARKALGAFYTPRAVVSYMVDEALCSYLGSKVPSVDHEKLSRLMKVHPDEYVASEHFTPEEIMALVAAIGSVRIIDHAAGSGAYPMGALQRLVDLLQKLDPNNRVWKRALIEKAELNKRTLRQLGVSQEVIVQVEDRIERIRASFNERGDEYDYLRKVYLIEDCIYAVDLQPVACQIAKLRFFIALLVDQKPDPKRNNWGIEPMPNLETKVVAANALISVEIAVGQQMDLLEGVIEKLRKDLENVRHLYFDARDPRRKRSLRAEDRSLRSQIAAKLEENGLDHDVATTLAAWDPYDQNASASFFNPSWMFGFRHTDDKFDIVLANPPYVRQEKIKHLKKEDEEKHRLKDQLKTYRCYTGTADLYVYFYERALQLLRPDGAFAFITSNKWYRSTYGQKLRALLSTEATLHHVIDFDIAPVFEAIAFPTIVVGKNTSAKKDHIFRSLVWDPKTDKAEIEHFARFYAEHAKEMNQKDLMPDPYPAKPKAWQFIDSGSRKILDRIRKAGIPLGDFVHGRMYRGILTGLNEAFVVDRATRDDLIADDPKSEELLKPFLRGRDVKRWRIEYQDLWLIFTRRGIDIKKYKAIRRHLEKYREQLEPKPQDWENGEPWQGRKAGSYEWYEIQDNIAYFEEFDRSKIYVPCIERDVAFAVDHGVFHGNDKTSIIVAEQPEALTAVLNSPIHWWYAKETYPTKQGSYVEFKPTFMAKFPIPEKARQCPPLTNLAKIVASLTQHKDLPPRDSLMLGYFEQILNALVYELYFPEDLHKKGLMIFDLVEKAKLPDIESLPEAKRLAILRETFERIYDLKHPIRGALQTLRSLDVVRIIEGEP